MSLGERIPSSSYSDKEDCPPLLNPEGFMDQDGSCQKYSNRITKPKVKTRPKTLFRFANWTNTTRGKPPNVENVEKTGFEVKLATEERMKIKRKERYWKEKEAKIQAKAILDLNYQEPLPEMSKFVRTPELNNEMKNTRKRERNSAPSKTKFAELNSVVKQSIEERRLKNRERMRILRNKRRLAAWFEANDYSANEIYKLTPEQIEARLREIDIEGIPTLSPQKQQKETDPAQLPSSSSTTLPSTQLYHGAESSYIVSDGVLLGMDDSYRPSAASFNDFKNLCDTLPPSNALRLNPIEFFRNRRDRNGYTEEDGRVLQNL